ncbi:hypothetical protein FB45DRAFT_928688 [Roridomyces roridus]|uniref:Protein CPL1-like domain-containing protein n=1 Tax=Roridomyces roridus TaxID=1738132 RepID=A0AAD7FFM7_9AGAR|nr:hypothetical protein FB45DRAFT_928688 [Roridomyces roridus]
MLLAPTLLVSSLAGFLLPQVNAAHSHSSPTRTHASRLPSRDLLDLCIDIPKLALGLLDDLLGVDLDLCLCVHNLDIYLDTSVNVTLQNNALANVNASGKCTPLPENAHRLACNPRDPCQYECNTGYFECGNKCVSSSALCPSARPRSLKSRSQLINTMADAQAYCKSLSGGRTTVCGVENGGPNAFECVNVQNNLESCGGCTVDPPFLPKSTLLPTGRNCGAIPNAVNASCEKSKCKVQYRSDITKRMHKASLLNLDLSDDEPLPATNSSHPMLSPSAAGSMLSVLKATNSAASSPAPANVGLDNVLASIGALMSSSPDQIPSSATSALHSTAKAQTALTECGCGDDLLSSLDGLSQALLDLLGQCSGSSDAPSSSSAPGSSSAPTVPGPDPSSCQLNVNLDPLLCGLGTVNVDSSLLCALGSITNAVQQLVNSLGLGPDAVSCSSGAASTTVEASDPASTASSDPAVPSSVLSDIPIVVTLGNQASSQAGNVASSDACSGDQDLLSSLASLTNSLVDGLGLGGLLLVNKRQLDLSSLLNLGGLLGGSGSSLDSLTDLNGLLSDLGPVIQSTLLLLGSASPSCASSSEASSLSSTLNSLGPVLKSLTDGLGQCGCQKNPAVANAFAKAASAPSKRRGLVNVL